MKRFFLMLPVLFCAACGDQIKKGATRLDLPNGDIVVVDRRDIWDPPMSYYSYRILSAPSAIRLEGVEFTSVLTGRDPEFALISSDKPTVIGVVAKKDPDRILLLHEVGTKRAIPYRYLPEAVEHSSEDPRYGPLRKAYEDCCIMRRFGFC